jgi:hypothetical protein
MKKTRRGFKLKKQDSSNNFEINNKIDSCKF